MENHRATVRKAVNEIITKIDDEINVDGEEGREDEERDALLPENFGSQALLILVTPGSSATVALCGALLPSFFFSPFFTMCSSSRSYRSAELVQV